MGLQKEAVSKKIVEIYDLPLSWEEYADLAQAQIEVLMKNCHLMPGMYETLQDLTNRCLFFFSFLRKIFLKNLKSIDREKKLKILRRLLKRFVDPFP